MGRAPPSPFASKRIIYADLGVREYFIFDPLDGSIPPQLRGFRLEGSEYIPLIGTQLRSEVLGLDLVIEKDVSRLYDPQSGEQLRFHDLFSHPYRRAVMYFSGRET